ncbi:TPA: hypothetical protein ACGW3M_001000 [Pseudomonas aeruginosa]|nr:hypothetical protein [Pseudomonas aeruginosa]ELJ2276182.1 hypothetical protein [Pseudomonas aeruginosa]
MSTEQSIQREEIQIIIQRGSGGALSRPLDLLEPAAMGYAVWAGVDQPELQGVSLEQAHAMKWELLASGRLAAILDADGYLVQETDPGLIEREHLCHILDVLREYDLIYHLDDDPADMIVVGSGAPVFTDSEADYLWEEIQRIRNVIGNDALWEAASPFLGLNDDEPEQKETTRPGPRLG